MWVVLDPHRLPSNTLKVICHLHLRLTPDFLPLLLGPLLSALAPSQASKDGDKDKEDKERLSRQRTILKIVAELATVHAWAEGVVKGLGEVGKVLQALVGTSNGFSLR